MILCHNWACNRISFLRVTRLHLLVLWIYWSVWKNIQTLITCIILFTCFMEWKLVHIEKTSLSKNRNMKVDIDHIGNKTYGTIITFNRYLWDWNTFWVLPLLDALLLLVPYGLWPSRWFIDFFIPILPAISSLGLEFIPPLNTNGLKKKSI